MSRAAARAERKTKQLGRASGRAAKRMSGFSRIVSRLGSRLGAAALAAGALVAAFAGFRTISEFGFTMAQIRGVVIDTTLALAEQEAQFLSLRDAARQFGATTEFTSKQSAEGALALGRAGFSTNEILASLGDTLNLATAGVLELGTASRITSNTIRQFGLEASQTNEVVDSLVSSANASNTTVGELGQAMAHAGTLAASLGFSVQETSAALAVLANRGITASKAGTALRGIMVRLLNPTGEAADIIDRLARNAGMTKQAFSLLSNTFADVIKNLNTAGASASELETIFGRFQIAGALGLVQSADDLLAMTVRIEEAKDEAERLADVMRDTLKVDVLTLKSAIEALVLNLGDSGLTAAFRSVIQFATEVTRVLGGVTEANVEISKSAEVVAIVLRGAVIALGLYAAVLGTIAIATGIATLATGAFTLALSINPIVALVTVIGLAASALYQYRDAMVDVGGESTRVGDIVGAVWDVIVDRVRFAAESVTGILDVLVGWFSDAWDEIVAQTEGSILLIRKLWEGLANIFPQRSDDPASGRAGAAVNARAASIARVFKLQAQSDKEQQANQLRQAAEIHAQLVANETELFALIERRNNLSLGDKLFFSPELKSLEKQIKALSITGEIIPLGRGAKELEKEIDRLQSFMDNRALHEALGTGIPEGTETALKHFMALYEELATKAGVTAATATAEAIDVALSTSEQKALDRQNALDAAVGVSSKALSFREALAARRAASSGEAAKESIELWSFLGNVIAQSAASFDPVIKKLGLINSMFMEQVRIRSEASDKSRIFIKDFEAQLDHDLALSSATADSVGRMVEFDKIRKGIIRSFGGDIQEADIFLEAHDSKIQALLAKYEQLAKNDKLRRIGEDVGTSLGNAFEDAVFGVKSLDDAMKDLIKTLLRVAFQKQVTDKLSAGFGNVFAALGTAGSGGPKSESAKGNSFVGGRIQAFAQGGGFNRGSLITKPTLFGQSDGLALGGELGTEAIMPLKRMASGNLGIEAKLGGSGGGGDTTNHYTFNITTPNPEGFRRSMGQVTRDAQRATATPARR